MNLRIHPASGDDMFEAGILVGELLGEITSVIGVPAFNFNLDETRSRLSESLAQERYFMFLARADAGRILGFIGLCESYALYAEGRFGTIPELYVRPEYRSRRIGQRLLTHAKFFGASRGWKCLEVTTPPLPHFDKTLAFYEREGLAITGGRKLKIML